MAPSALKQERPWNVPWNVPVPGTFLLKVFEEAAREIAKESNSESVRIVVGTVQNSTFAQELQAAGYVLETEISIGWTKIINL